MPPIQDYLSPLPTVNKTPDQSVWTTYDREADVMYINFKKPSVATDSELSDDDVIVRYEGGDVVGYTVLHASQR
ncbi:MAG: DUF2283 domain-containing protein [Chloroflexi bacterium]|nr:DUF2283 domain-containing protein [Chloroflexota bacterium]